MPYSQLVSSLADPETRWQVADLLRAALPDSKEALLDGLRNGVPSVRRWSALVLDHADHDPEVEDALRLATTDRNRKVRRAALHAMSCAPCKPDGCLTTDGVALLVDSMLHDRSVAVRRTCAGSLMWNQHGRGANVVRAFETLLASADDHVLRQRAAWFLALSDAPFVKGASREWLPAWKARVAELLASQSLRTAPVSHA